MSPDVAVVGLGPAGRVLAHRLAASGVRVLGVDPAPDRRWRQTLGGWEPQLPDWVDPAAVGTCAATVVIRAGKERALPWRYVVLDTAAFQDSLTLDGVAVRIEVAGDLAGLAPVVVDCRGSAPTGLPAPAVPVQTAYGLVLNDDPGLLDGVEAVLMDWRPYDGRPRWGTEAPTFCYTVPVPDGLLVEETCLAAAPPIGVDELRRRLRIRLAARGLRSGDLEGRRVEKVHIPMLAATDGRPANRFGSAGGELNPISGYSVFASLRQADAAASSLLTHGRVPEPPAGTPVLRRAALRALTRLRPDACVSLFDAFSRLAPRDQWSVLDPSSPAPDLAAALTHQWAGMPMRDKASLIRATAGVRR